MKTATLYLILFACAAGGQAQDMVTDRPDVTESALVISKKLIQIESGAERVDYGIYSEWTRPSVMVRMGVGSNLELRLGFAGWTGITVGNLTGTYMNDTMFEAKYQLTSADAALPMAVLLVSTWPTGDDQVSVGRTEAGFKLAGSHAINDRVAIGMNFGAISLDEGIGRTWSALASASAGVTLNERTGGFVEVLADIPHRRAWQPVLDGGLTFAILPDLQLDAYIGKGLNKHAADFIAGAGLSFRFSY